MSDEVSAEAAVAGEAAAAAVEELQSRQETQQEAATAVVAAEVAAGMAESATEASEAALDAVSATAAVAEEASITADAAGEAVLSLEEQVAQIRAGQQETHAAIVDMRNFFNSRFPEVEPPEQTFEEVAVNDRTESGNHGGGSPDSASKEGGEAGSGAAPEKRHGLRHRANRS